MAEIVTSSRSGGLWLIRFSRPHRRNAVNAEFSHLLRRAVEEALQSATAIALEGEGPVFCAGGDMSDLSDDEAALAVMEEMRETLRLLHDAPIPVAAFVDGTAVGGGAEIAACAHLLCAGPNAQFGFIQRRVGLTPGWGGGAYLQERVGRGRALELLLSGRMVSAEEARAIGLVDLVVSQGTWEHRHDSLLGLDRDYAEGLIASLRSDWAEASRLHFSKLWVGEGHRAAVRGFLERP